MPVQIGNIAMPTTMNKRAKSYNFTRGEIIARNGIGEAITNIAATVTWTWGTLNQAEFSWLISTLLLGQASRAFSANHGTIVYNELWQEEDFTYCTVLRPSYKGYSGLHYYECTLVIDGLR